MHYKQQHWIFLLRTVATIAVGNLAACAQLINWAKSIEDVNSIVGDLSLLEFFMYVVLKEIDIYFFRC